MGSGIITPWMMVVAVGLLIVLSVVYSTLRTGISPMPSSKQARDVILHWLDEVDGIRIVELGSGWGNLLIPIARRFPDKVIVGYELSLIPFWVSQFLKYLFRLHNIQILRRDFLNADLSGTDVLICYLYPGGMKSLKNKIQSDNLRPIVISNTFALEDIKPERMIRLNDIYGSPLYLYKIRKL